MMLFLTILLVVVGVVGVSLLTAYDFQNEEWKKPNIKLTTFVGIGILAIMLFISSISAVGVGEVGIKTRFGAVVGKPLNPGIAIHLPYVEKINIMDTKIKKVEVDASGASKDLQTVSTKIAINYAVLLEDANDLFQNVGLKYEDIIIAPAIQESVKAATALYTAEELISKRSEVSQKMADNLEKKIKDSGLKITSFNIINFDFSLAFNTAIEAKQVAQQNVLKAQQELEQAKVDAEKKVAQAEADAKAKIANAEAEAESLRLQKQEITEDLLRLREIEVRMEIAKKWNGQLPSTVLGDSIPMLDLNK